MRFRNQPEVVLSEAQEAAPAAPSTAPSTPTPETNVNILSILLKLAAFGPVIAKGIVAEKQDLALGDKLAAANDAADLAITGAKVGLPDSDVQIVDAIGGLVKANINATVTALHNSAAQAAPAPAA